MRSKLRAERGDVGMDQGLVQIVVAVLLLCRANYGVSVRH